MPAFNSPNKGPYTSTPRNVLAMRFILWVAIMMGVGFAAFGQAPLRITLLSDLEKAGGPSIDSLINDELTALLDSRYDLTVNTIYTGGRAAEINTAMNEAYTSADVVVGSGLATSSALTERSVYPKPTIAAVVLADAPTPEPSPLSFGEGSGERRQGAAAGAEEVEKRGTGVENFTFVQSPFDVAADLTALKSIVDYDQLVVITTESLRPTLEQVISEVSDLPITYVVGQGSVPTMLTQFPAGTRAAYLSPLVETMSYAQQAVLLDSLTQRGIATFGLIDQPMLELGMLAAYSSSENLQRLPRRVALDVLRIMDGIPAAELSTDLSGFSSGLIINMETARRAGLYPGWELMRSATLLNPNELPDARVLTLEGAVMEGLANNLGYDLAEYDVALADADVGIAKSNLLPQLDLATTLVMLDGTTVANSFGQQGQFNWTAKASLSQVILSEPALAGVAINELLLEGQRAALETSQLDVILDVVTAYLNILQAKVFADLQNENLAVTRANLDAAGTKREAGAVGASDVYRWESELARNRIEVNNAQAQLAQARYNLNQLLNRPIDEAFRVPEFQGQDTLLGIVGQTMLPLLNDARDLDRLASFLELEAKRNLPTLRQLELAIRAQDRQLLSAKRSLYLPTIALSGGYDYRIANYGVPDIPAEFSDFVGGGINNQPRGIYNFALNANFPIFQGFNRKRQIEKAKVATLQAQTQRQDVENQLLQRLYSNIETVVASYRNLRLARQAAETATKNFRIVEDLYRAGATNITSLVDAQNVTLQSNISATNAGYQFVADFVALQRSSGSYQFLGGEAEQLEFVRRFLEFQE